MASDEYPGRTKEIAWYSARVLAILSILWASFPYSWLVVLVAVILRPLLSWQMDLPTAVIASYAIKLLPGAIGVVLGASGAALSPSRVWRIAGVTGLLLSIVHTAWWFGYFDSIRPMEFEVVNATSRQPLSGVVMTQNTFDKTVHKSMVGYPPTGSDGRVKTDRLRDDLQNEFEFMKSGYDMTVATLDDDNTMFSMQVPAPVGYARRPNWKVDAKGVVVILMYPWESIAPQFESRHVTTAPIPDMLKEMTQRRQQELHTTAPAH